MLIKLHHFPIFWKSVTVICIHKAGKLLSDPTRYRPISLPSFLSKVVAKRLIVSTLILHQFQ